MCAWGEYEGGAGRCGATCVRMAVAFAHARPIVAPFNVEEALFGATKGKCIHQENTRVYCRTLK